jgi:hypothetical protein
MPQRFEENHDPRAQAIREAAQSWVARFAPLVMADPELDDRALKRHLDLVESLRSEGPLLQNQFAAVATSEDFELETTMRRAVAQLNSIENDLRRRLARIAPGDPEGHADLDVLKDRLNEREARLEVGAPTDLEVPSVLELLVAPGSPGAGMGMGIFGLGWTAFTTIHCVLMVGGMWKAMGPIALAMLLFYAIFFAVGGGMLYGAYLAASDERIELRGYELTVIRTFLGIQRKTIHQLSENSQAALDEFKPAMKMKGYGDREPTIMVVLHDVNGKAIGLGANATKAQQTSVRDQINRYLMAQKEFSI